jgi:hypothetical protein
LGLPGPLVCLNGFGGRFAIKWACIWLDDLVVAIAIAIAKL